MYACMYICLYVCRHVSRYVCMYVCIYVCVYVCMYVCMYVCIYEFMYVCMSVCVYGVSLFGRQRGGCRPPQQGLQAQRASKPSSGAIDHPNLLIILIITIPSSIKLQLVHQIYHHTMDFKEILSYNHRVNFPNI